MPAFTVSLDTRILDKKLEGLDKRVLGKAIVGTLNDLAFRGRKAVQATLPKVFDKPTPFVTRAVRSEFARPERPVSQVFIVEESPGKGRAPVEYLRTHARGGTRQQNQDIKRSERRMQRIGVLGRNEGWVPARAMRLDRYGNVPGPKMVQILSQLKAFTEAGFDMNVTDASAARNPKRTLYFAPRPGSKLKHGVYERYGRRPTIKKGPRKGEKGLPRRVRPVLLFVKVRPYRRRFDMLGIVRKEVSRRIESAFAKNLGFHMNRAGLTL